MDALIRALSDPVWLVGISVAVLFTCAFVGGLFLLNRWKGWFISTTVHEQLLAAQRDRASDAASDVVAAQESSAQLIAAVRADMDRRMDQHRADMLQQMDRMREEHDQAFTRQAEMYQAIIATKDRDIDFLRTSWHLTDQALRETDDSDRREIRAMLGAALHFFSEFQRKTGMPELMPQSLDGVRHD